MKMLFALLFVPLMVGSAFAQSAPLVNPPKGQNNYAPIDTPTFTGLVTVTAGEHEAAEVLAPNIDASNILVAPSGTWTLGGLNLSGAFTINNAPIGGQCPSGEFVDALSPTGRLTCAAAGGGGGGPAVGTIVAWQPTLSSSGTPPTVAYGTRLGAYSQIGSLLWWNFVVTWGSQTNGTGTARITGLPFTQTAVTQYSGGACYSYNGVTLGANVAAVSARLFFGDPNMIGLVQTFTNGGIVQSLPMSALGNSGQLMCSGWSSI